MSYALIGVASLLLAAVMPPMTTLAGSGPAVIQVRQDPADSLYRAAREALNRGEYSEAAESFRQLRDRYPDSAYAADSYYWEAFARYKTGETPQLESALETLELQRQHHPDAATRRDAETLAVRIHGLLAQRGNAEAAVRLAEQARRLERANAVVARVSDAVTQSNLPAVRTQEPELATRERQSDPCADDDDELRIAALNALARSDPERALPLLRQVLSERDECSVRLRESALFLLVESDVPEAAEILVDVIRNDPSPEVRRSAVGLLGDVGTPQTLDVLEEIVRTPADSSLHEMALFALAMRSDERAVSTLREVAADESRSEELRRSAIALLADQPSAENAGFLRDLYPRLESPQLKEIALFSLVRMESGENAQWLLDRARDQGEPIEVRMAALALLGEIESVPLSALINLYDATTEREMKEQLIFVIGQHDDPAAIDKLIEIVRGETDRRLREMAVHLLGESDDPRATDALVELVRQP